jgi:hypothetical protein
MILTRYLYPKHNVIYSLYVSFLLVDKDQANFWAYELYFSGFRTETIELLIQIYNDFYMEEPIKPIFQKWLIKIYEKWQKDMTPDVVSTIIENMIRREPNYSKFQQKIGYQTTPQKSIKYIQKPIFVMIKDTPPQYQTKFADISKGWKLPRLVCEYQSYSDPNMPMITITDYDNWIYYASGSPIWRTRVKKYGGKIMEKDEKILFSDESLEEEFMDLFHMEPDEQPLEIQSAWFGKKCT